jgi:hypothetical protein
VTPFAVLLCLLCSLVAFLAGYAVAFARLRPLQPPTAQSEVIITPHPGPTRVTFTPVATEGTPEWSAAMRGLGARMLGAGTRLVVFVHGSFVGDDPLALARMIEGATPRLSRIAGALRGLTRAQVTRVLGDLSNFAPEYVESLVSATGIEAIEFTWSGENHHAARVQEAVRLARVLAQRAGDAFGPNDRFLLVGHSHGGQLFALLSQLVARSPGYDELIRAAAARGEDVGDLEQDLERLRACAFDVTTFGTPPRYDYVPGPRFRLLHLVNHRATPGRLASLRGMLHTRRGDYVHYLGAPGSDWPASSARDRALNERLDKVLGAGTDVRAWLRHLAHGLRVSPYGHTLLVDYGDQAQVVPNFLATGFGHAAYTRREAMLFHLQLVTDHFHPLPSSVAVEPRGSPWTAPLRLLSPRRPSPTTRDEE